MLKAGAKKLTIAIFLGACLSIARNVKAELIPTNKSLDKVTKVESLQDIKASNWAYKALKKLSDRFNCDLKGIDLNNEITRYEFAFVLNQCLEEIAELDRKELLLEEIQIIEKLRLSFAEELSRVNRRVDRVSEQIELLERNQFSPTSKLQGSFVIQIEDTFGNRARFPGNLEAKDTTRTTLGYQSKLRLNTSFTGRDRLRIELEAEENPSFDSEELNNTRMTRSRTRGSTNGFWEFDEVYYQFPVFNNRGRVTVSGTSISFSDIGETLNPVSGGLSRFGRRNPFIMRQSGVGGGLRLGLDREKNIELVFAYLAEDAEQPSPGNGLFNGSFGILNQLIIEPTDRLAFTLDYVYKYQTGNDVSIDESTGSSFGRRPFRRNATTANNFGLAWEWQPTQNFKWGGWGGIALADRLVGGDDRATLINWATMLEVLDLFGEGNSAGIVLGMPPKVVYNSISDRQDPDTSFHVEVLYRYKVNRFIHVTPGFYVVTAPNHDDRNSPIWVTIVRTQFRF